MENVPPERWNHVDGTSNPADCASRGLYPTELLEHQLWWDGPSWLSSEVSSWPKQSNITQAGPPDEEREISFLTTVVPASPIIPLGHFSSFTTLKRITAWMLRFIENCRARKEGHNRVLTPLTVHELTKAEEYWITVCQADKFRAEIEDVKQHGSPPNSSCLLPLHPFLDSRGLLHVGGREQHSGRSFSRQHPIILPGAHPITTNIIRTEHVRLLHGGPTLVTSSLSGHYHIIGSRKVVHSVIRGCMRCRRTLTRPQPQILGQLPIERVTPGPVFEKVGVDYAGPISIKLGSVRKPTVVKSYVCVFVSLTVKAVHIELVSDLTTEAFLATLRRFVARRGKPSLIWSDHGSNFVGAARELKELGDFLSLQKVHGSISNFCSSQSIEWRFIPEHAPHFGGIWEAAVKSLKSHLRHVTNNIKFTFEELTTVLAQIEACLNSRPLAPLPLGEECMEVLTPGHFLIGRPLESLPDSSMSYRSISLLRRWHLCQSVIRHFWKRWSHEYLTTLRRFTKWNHPSRSMRVGDMVILQEDNMVPTKWPLGRVIQVYPGKDKLNRVVSVKTATGTYKRPVTKVALLLPADE